MDYEQEYKKAFEAAKGLHDAGNALTKMQMEIVFPQLAESEDERIRKFLVDYFASYKIGNVTTKLNGVRIDDILNYLEKQKENPKSSDSIPSDCTSDAKCEDRWHKVTDSLPDSAREVLCKDAIGNFFIGRYYHQSQCWEVMMYDDCDKSNDDNPPVVKWCEIPTEKQKEQKPAEWSEEDEEIFNNIIEKAKGGHWIEVNEITWLITRFKSLRSQSHWKPSEEQMKALQCAIVFMEIRKASDYDISPLKSLYEQLKKL